MRAILILLAGLALAGCATGGPTISVAGETPQGSPDRYDSPSGSPDYRRDGPNLGDGAGAPQAKWSTCVSNCEDQCKEGQRLNPRTKRCEAAPCRGACGPGEYCDQSSGMDRCMKDVVPAASTPGR